MKSTTLKLSAFFLTVLSFQLATAQVNLGISNTTRSAVGVGATTTGMRSNMQQTVNATSNTAITAKNKVRADASSITNNTIKAASATSVNADAKTTANASSNGQTSAKDGSIKSSGTTVVNGDANAKVTANEKLSEEAKSTANKAKNEGAAQVKNSEKVAAETSNSANGKVIINADAQSATKVNTGANR